METPGDAAVRSAEDHNAAVDLKHASLNAAIAAVMAEVGYVFKSGTASEKVGGYKYAKAQDFIAAARPSMVRHGVIGPLPISISTTEEKIPRNQGFEILVSVRAIYEFRHAHSSDTLRVEVGGAGMDTREKAIFKAMTGAYKYAIGQTFCLETGDDPERADGDAKEEADARIAAEKAAFDRGFEEGAKRSGGKDQIEVAEQAGRAFVIRQELRRAADGFNGRKWAVQARNHGIDFEALKFYVLWRGWAKLATWSEEKIGRLLTSLATPEGIASWERFADECGTTTDAIGVPKPAADGGSDDQG